MSFKFKSIRKLLHAKKACKSFSNIVRSKLHDINVPKAMKSITTFLVSSHHKLRIRPIRRRSTTNPHNHLLQKGFPAIFIDELYVAKHSRPSKDPKTSEAKEPGATSTGHSKLEKDVATKHLLARERENIESRNSNRLHTFHIRGVDERAEDFISRFHKEMKLQREQSIIDFQEMLARSV